MNYDSTAIPDGYDRARDHGPEMLDLWMDQIASHVRAQHPKVILDLGCGTGRFASALATRLRGAVVGVDPSERMLAHARRKGQQHLVRYVRGVGEAVPLSNGSVGLVFISMAFHHFSDPSGVVRECRRVLADGGPIVLRTGTRDRIAEYPYVPYFPQSVPLMEARLPTAAVIEETFHAAGFRREASQVIVQRIAASFAAYADKLAAGGDSILASLSTEEFNAGLTALRTHSASVDPRAVTEPIDYVVFR